MNTTPKLPEHPSAAETRPPQLAWWMGRRARMPDTLVRAFWRQALDDAHAQAAPGSAEAHAAAVAHMQASCHGWVRGRLVASWQLLRRVGHAYARRALRSDAALLAHVALVAALGALIAS